MSANNPKRSSRGGWDRVQDNSLALQTGIASLMQNKKCFWLKLAFSPPAPCERDVWDILITIPATEIHNIWVSPLWCNFSHPETPPSIKDQPIFLIMWDWYDFSGHFLQIPSFPVTVLEDTLLVAWWWCTNASLGLLTKKKYGTIHMSGCWSQACKRLVELLFHQKAEMSQGQQALRGPRVLLGLSTLLSTLLSCLSSLPLWKSSLLILSLAGHSI